MNAIWQKLRWRIAYWISRFAISFGHLLPTPLCYLIARPIAAACFHVLARHRDNLIRNLDRVVGPEQARPAAQRVFLNFAKYVIDFYQLPARGREALDRRIQFADWDKLDAVLDEDNGSIFVTLHLGQAELGGAALSTYKHPINVVAEALTYGPMDAFIQGLRRQLGMKIIAANRAKFGIVRSLNRGEVLAMMFDAVPPGEGVCVQLFGAPAQFSGAPARIALRTGARVLPAVVRRSDIDDRNLLPEIDFDLSFTPSGNEEADVIAFTQAIATSLETSIRRYADQWFAFRPVWLADMPSATPPPTPEAKSPGWRLWSLQLAVWLAGRLPEAGAYGLARLTGDLAYRLRGHARADVEDNMRHVIGRAASPELVQGQAREAFRNVARYYVDLIRLAKTPAERLLGRQVRLHGFEDLQRRFEGGHGVVVATAHYGNPEVAVQVGQLLGLNVFVLAEPLQPPAFARLMSELRETHGPRYEDVSFSAVANAIRHLRAGGCLAITCDRDLQGSGARIPFFGETARIPLGAVELAARTGSALVPGVCRRGADGIFDIYFEPAIDLVDTGDAHADAIVNARTLLARAEAWIAEDPGQWLPLERIWKPLAPEPARLRRPVDAILPTP